MNDYLKSALTERYLRILSEVDPAFFKQCQQGNLSDLFLASVPDGYSNAKNKNHDSGARNEMLECESSYLPIGYVH